MEVKESKLAAAAAAHWWTQLLIDLPTALEARQEYYEIYESAVKEASGHGGYERA